MPHPATPDFDPFDFDALELDLDIDNISPFEDLNAFSALDTTPNDSSPSSLLPASVNSAPTSTEFQADAALVQSTTFDTGKIAAITGGLPPTIPEPAACEWYLPPPELGTTLLAEYLTDWYVHFLIRSDCIFC